MTTQELRVTLERQVEQYAARNPRSRALFQRAQRSLPGGNTRSGVHLAPFPLYAELGAGAYLVDADGHRLLDFVNNNTALVLGHAHPEVVEALQRRVSQGTAFSRPTELEIELAETLCERVPSLERVRFCSSGTEAVMNCVRAARAFTGRRLVAKFEGAYHGTSDEALVSYLPPLGADLGPAARPRPHPASAGLSRAADEVVVLPFNDAVACERIIREHGADLAAVIVDPLSTNAGLTLPEDGFLPALRTATERVGALLIFDEIISLRVARGGAQEMFRVRPDLTAMAKVIAGGTAGGAFGGRADVMALYDPRGGAPAIPHSGTYNGNPLAMVAGLTTLRLLTPAAYARLEACGRGVAEQLRAVFREAGVEASVCQVGSLFRLYFLPRPPVGYRDAAREDASLHRLLQLWLLNHDVLWAPLANVSLATEDEHVARLIERVRALLRAR